MSLIVAVGLNSGCSSRVLQPPATRTRAPRKTANAFLNAGRIAQTDPDHACVRRYLTYVKTRVSSKGQIVLPAELRLQDRIEAGQEFDVERVDRGEYRLVRRAERANEGLVDWLLACPEKDFFVPIESESTDTL